MGKNINNIFQQQTNNQTCNNVLVENPMTYSLFIH